ncbi:DUF7094 domain-containing protein [Halalkalirubrum salinum]|uniref:DUF7094 domain-containing protein n=1 Tax=Halalkalirubrum salinum TaxID=2563889 RepID=UPI0010FB434B|nr:hypothetical protein [Halalkalirubrum salinum]
MKSLPLVVAVFLLTASVGIGAISPADMSTETPTERPPDTLTETTDPNTEFISPDWDVFSAAGSERPPHQLQTDGPELRPPSETQTRTLANNANAVERYDLDREHVDLGPAVSVDTERTAGTLETGAVERRIEKAGSDGETQRQVLDELNTIEQAIVTLEERQQQAIEQYNAEEIDSHELVITLVTIQEDALLLETRLDTITSGAEEGGYTVNANRQQEIRSSLQLFSGPVRGYAASLLYGDSDPDRIYVETTERGIVLSAIDGTTYQREVLRPDRREPSGGTVSLEDAESIVEANYPEIFNQSTTVRVSGSESIVRVTIVYDGGELIAFVDGGSEQVFKEHRSARLSGVVASNERSRTQSGLDVRVRQTYGGGPFEVAVVDSDDGSPVSNATVTVGQGSEESDVIGTTNENGIVHGIEPRGSYTVSVLRGTNTAFLELEATEPSPLAEPAE